MIVKIQQSIESSDGVRRVLVYDRTRKHYYETDNPEEVANITEILGDDLKAYFNADIVETRFQINDRVSDQKW